MSVLIRTPPSPTSSTISTSSRDECERSISPATLSDQGFELGSWALLKQFHALLRSYSWALSAFQSLREENIALKQQMNDGKRREIELRRALSERDRTIAALTDGSRQLVLVSAELQATRLRVFDLEARDNKSQERRVWKAKEPST